MKGTLPEGIPKRYAYEEIADLYLASAMNYATEAFRDITAAKIHAVKLQEIDPPDIGLTIGKSFEEMEAVIETMPQVQLAGDAWAEALYLSRSSVIPANKSDLLFSVDIAGHFVMLAAFVELELNAYLETQIEKGDLDTELWDAIEKWDILQKSIFAFGDIIKKREIRIAGLKRLQAFRNRFVHFKSKSFGTHEVSVTELLNIWSDISTLLGAITILLPPSGFDEMTSDFTLRFVAK